MVWHSPLSIGSLHSSGKGFLNTWRRRVVKGAESITTPLLLSLLLEASMATRYRAEAIHDSHLFPPELLHLNRSQDLHFCKQWNLPCLGFRRKPCHPWLHEAVETSHLQVSSWLSVSHQGVEPWISFAPSDLICCGQTLQVSAFYLTVCSRMDRLQGKGEPWIWEQGFKSDTVVG